MLLGLCAFTRLNHLPAVFLVAGASLLYWRPRSSARRLLPAVLVAVLLLPLAHNLVYGGAFVLTTRSTFIPRNLVISPGRLLDLPTQPDARAEVAQQLRLMVNSEAGWLSRDQIVVGLRASEALWVVAIALAVWRRTLYHFAIALLPASYLVVHLLYVVRVYYPRHIIAAHLAMAVSLCLAALPLRSGRSLSECSSSIQISTQPLCLAISRAWRRLARCG